MTIRLSKSYIKNTINIVLLSCLFLVCLAVCAACENITIDGSSPRFVEARITSASEMTESSQCVNIDLVFDQAINVSGSPEKDFKLLLNGSSIDTNSILFEAQTSDNTITLTLRPTDKAATRKGGAYFALYEANISLASKRLDGALPALTGASGSAAILESSVTGNIPSGFKFDVVSSSAGSTSQNDPAQATIRVTSPALVRAITWFSFDGGATKFIKHNHNFTTADKSACAADLADVINNTAELGLAATSDGEEVSIIAKEINDGQIIEMVVVEGVDVSGNSYEGSGRSGDGA